MRFTREQLGLPVAPSKALVRRLRWWAAMGHAQDPNDPVRVPLYVRSMAAKDRACGFLALTWPGSSGLRITQRGLDVLAEAETTKAGGAG